MAAVGSEIFAQPRRRKPPRSPELPASPVKKATGPSFGVLPEAAFASWISVGASYAIIVSILLEIITHDRAGWHPASDHPEPGASEGGGVSAAGSARRYVGIKRIGLKRRGICASCGFQRRCDQVRCDALPAVFFSHVEAGQGPDRRVIHSLQLPQPIEPGHGISGRHLAPADSSSAIESKYAWRRTMLDGLPERSLVLLAWSLSIRTADPPVHTPTATADGALPEQVLERRPSIWRQRARGKFHVSCLSQRAVRSLAPGCAR